MIVPTDCKPSALLGSDESRPQLMHAWIAEHDGRLWICGTDSFIIGAVAIEEAPDGLKPGWLPRPVLHRLEKGMPATQVTEFVWEFDSAGATVRVALPNWRLPDAARYGVWADPPAETIPQGFALNGELLARLGAALGGPLMLMAREPNRAVVAIPAPDLRDRRAGLIMPVRGDSA